jgi:Transcription factor zinc-finger
LWIISWISNTAKPFSPPSRAVRELPTRMEEIKHLGIMVDRCTDCSGMYFDKVELELLFQVKEPEGFLNGP